MTPTVALGFQRAGFRSVGAFDVDPIACAAHDYLIGERATVAAGLGADLTLDLEEPWARQRMRRGVRRMT